MDRRAWWVTVHGAAKVDATDTMAVRGGLLTSDGGGSPVIPHGPSDSDCQVGMEGSPRGFQ